MFAKRILLPETKQANRKDDWLGRLPSARFSPRRKPRTVTLTTGAGGSPLDLAQQPGFTSHLRGRPEKGGAARLSSARQPTATPVMWRWPGQAGPREEGDGRQAQGVVKRARGLSADGVPIPVVPLTWGRSSAQALFLSGARFSLVKDVATD